MGDLLHLNLTNAILPLALLIALTVAVPALLAGDTLSQRRLALVVAATALLIWAVGAAIMAVLYARVNGVAMGAPWPHFQRSGLMGLMWGPVLGLVWLVRAQGVERRRGLMMGRGGDEAAD